MRVKFVIAVVIERHIEAEDGQFYKSAEDSWSRLADISDGNDAEKLVTKLHADCERYIRFNRETGVDELL